MAEKELEGGRGVCSICILVCISSMIFGFKTFARQR